MLHRAGSRRIVVAGGDGSLHAVVAALHRRNDLERRVLGLIPLGTGNDFARGMDIPLDTEEAAQVDRSTARSRPVDLIVDELGEIVVNNVHVGAGAQASRRGHTWKERLGSVGVGKVNLGKLGYPIGALLAAFMPPQMRLRVEVDGEVVVDVDQPVLMVAVGNGTSVGGGAELTPEADPEDGTDRRDDLPLGRAAGASSAYAVRVRPGRHHERDDVLYLRGSTVTVSGEEFYCAADGEIYGPGAARGPGASCPRAYSMVLPHA